MNEITATSDVSVRPSDIKTDNLFSLVLRCSSEYTKQTSIYTTVEPCRYVFQGYHGKRMNDPANITLDNACGSTIDKTKGTRTISDLKMTRKSLNN